jgi:NAD(P)H dehydrogenase (quinone)
MHTNLSVVYQSNGGHTRRIAEAVRAGARRVEGTDVELLEIVSRDVRDGRWSNPSIMTRLNASDAIAFGCATYMGSASALFKTFLETAFETWRVQAWKDKFAAGFTNSASPSGDKLSTLMQLAVFAAQMGMLWVGPVDGPGGNLSKSTPESVNRVGSWLGVMAQSNVDQGLDLAPPSGDVETASRLGERLARITQRWHGRGSYVTERAAFF